MKQVVNTSNAPAAIGPYSQGIKTNNLIFVSGQLPINPENNQMGSSISEQAKQCLDNVQAVIEAAGSSLDKVVRVGIFMTDLSEFKTVNEIYATYFKGDCPARATVQVAALPMGAKIEIEAICNL